jgi:Uma2 family endonuclease
MYDDRTKGVGMESSEPRDDRLTYDDFVLFPDDGMRHEIIDGEHYVTPSPNLRHQELLGRLFVDIELFLRQHPGVGRVFLSPLDVVFTKWDVVEPDLLFVTSNQNEILTAQNVQGSPALVIEILSSGTRRVDEKVKLRLFDRGGVLEYWLVDPDTESVVVFRRQPDGSFPKVGQLTGDGHDVLTTPLIAGMAIPLAELFR